MTTHYRPGQPVTVTIHGQRYRDFLATKRMIAETEGVTVNPEQVNTTLFPFQRDLVAWALRKGRAAIFADTGLGGFMVKSGYEKARTEGKSNLCRVWDRVSALSVSTRPWAWKVLLEGMPRTIETAWRHSILRPVRQAVLPCERGTRQSEVTLLFTRVLYAMAGLEPQRELVHQNRSGSRASDCCGSGSWQTSETGRGRPPYRPQQTQQSPLEFGRLPEPIAACESSLRGDVR